jgi:3-phosphoinositide dependent protein kinase-1
MFLLTSTPRLIYIDASNNIKKGEIPLDSTLKCKPMNFKLFDVVTPGRSYHLEDSEGGALQWCEAIENIRDKYLSRSKN